MTPKIIGRTETATLIRKLHAEIVAELENTLAKARLEIGELLDTQKAAIGHGNYTSWVKRHTGLKPSTARQYVAPVPRPVETQRHSGHHQSASTFGGGCRCGQNGTACRFGRSVKPTFKDQHPTDRGHSVAAPVHRDRRADELRRGDVHASAADRRG